MTTRPGLLLATVVLLAACTGGGTDPVPAGPGAAAGPRPTAASGTQLVGMGRVVVEVPAEWANQETRCGQPVHDTVYFPESGVRDYLVVRRNVSSLLVAATGSPGERRPSERGHVTLEGVTFTVAGPRRDDALLQRVLGSARLLPEGWTTVPYVEYGASVDTTKALLAEAGLVGESPDVNFPHYVTGTEPAAGEVVRTGSTVELAIGDG